MMMNKPSEDLTEFFEFRAVTALQVNDELAWWFDRVPIVSIVRYSHSINIRIVHPISRELETHSYGLNDELLIHKK